MGGGYESKFKIIFLVGRGGEGGWAGWVSEGWGWKVLELVKYLSRNPNLKKDFFFGGGGGGWGGGAREGRGARGSDVFYKESKSKIFFWGGGRGGGRRGVGEWEARVGKFLLLSVRI